MADDIQSNIKINIDTTSAMDSIRLLQSQISAFHQQMSKMGAASVADSRNMQQNLINSINSTGQFAANITKIKTTAEQFSSSLEKNKLSMGEYFRYAGASTKTFGKLFASEFDTINKVARERVKDLQSQYIKLGRDANGAMQAIRVRPLVLDMQNLGTKTQIAAQRQQLLNQLLKQGSTNLLNFGKNTQWAGRQLMVGFTIPLSIMGGAAMKAYKEIEEASLRLKRVYGDFGTTAAETDKMVKQVQALALEYTKYGIAVKDSMEVAATAAATGKKGAELLAQIASANKLSALGGIDQQKALATTISLTDAFSISAKDLGKNINFLNAVENQTVLSIDDLTTAIPKAAPVIQQLGGDVKDLAFFLTAMKEGGINASEGANAIKSGLASIINPTNTASKMLQGFGINLRGIVNDNKGDVKKTVVDFAKALDTLDPINRAKAIEQLFGKFQFARMSTLFKNVIEQGSQASEVLKLANQSSLELSILAQRELGKIEASPLYKFQKAIADFQAQMAPVGEQFMKAVTPIINFGAEVLKNFNGLGEGVKGFIVQFVAVAGVIGPVLLMSFGLIANAVANVIKGFALVKDIFNKTGKSSMSLGDQVNYMTNEQIQAAAIASSLDQVHSKLKQTFTSEAAAVDMLTAAYQRSVAAQKAFNVPITPRTPRGPIRKYAAGGIISGPGTGTSDSILAMVSNGEAIIPAASVARNPGMVRQLVSGNIPGFVEGIMPGIRPDSVRTYTDFTALLSNEANAALTSNAASKAGVIKEFRNNPGAIQGPLIASLAEELGGAKTQTQINAFLKNNPDVIKYAENLSNNIASELSTLTTDKIGDKDLAPAVQRAIAKTPASKEMSDAVEKLSTAPTTFEDDTRLRQRSDGRLMAVGREKLTNLRGRYTSIYNRGKRLANALYPENTIVDPRAAHLTLNKDMSIDELEQHLSDKGVPLSPQAQAALSRKRRGVVQSPSGQEVAVTETARLQAEARAAGKKVIKDAEKAVAQGMAEEGQMRSPSRVTKQKGAQLVQGAVQGIQEGVDDAKRAGAQLGAAAAQGVSQSGRVAGVGGRRVRQEEMAPHSVTGDLVPLSMVNAPVQGPKPGTAAQKAGFTTAGPRGRVSNLLNNVGNKVSSGISGMSQGRFQGGMFGASMIAGLGSMVGGPVGEVSGALSMPLAIAGMFPKLQGVLGGIVGGLTRFIPVIGTALVAWQLWDQIAVPLIKKNADAYKAISDTLNITQERLDKINNFFGTEGTLSGIRATLAVSGDQTKEEATIAQQFQESEQFKETYQESAKEMAKLTDKEFRRAMEAYAVDLFGMGYEPDAVKAIVDAIAIEAKKTSVSIAPELFSLEKPEARQLMNKNINAILLEAASTAEKLQSQFDASGTGNLLEAGTGKYDDLAAAPYQSDAEDVAKFKSNVSEIGSYISALSGQFQNGELSAKNFTIQYDKLILATESMPGNTGIETLIASIGILNPELAKALELINAISGNSAGINLVIEASSLGIARNAQAELALALPGNENAKIRSAVEASYQTAIDKTKANNDLIDLEEKKIKNVEKQTQGLANTEQKINEKYDKRINQLEKIKALNDQLAKSQQGQLTLAEALNKGDIAAAARAAIDVQNQDIQNSLDNQKTGLDEARKAEVAPLKAAQEANTAAVDTLTDRIEKLNKKTFEIKLPEILEGKKVTREESQFGTDFMGLLGFNLASFANDVIFRTGKKIVPPGGTLKLEDVSTNANGGFIRGPGSGTSDDIPAMLSNGEYVIRANAVKTIGVNTLDKLNQADRIGFAAGGMVDKFKKKKPKPKPYTLDDLRKPISEKDDPEWYDYSYNFLNNRSKDNGIFRNYKYTSASSGFYKAKGPSEVRGQRDLIDYDGEKPEFTSVAATIKYYKGLIQSRRAGVPHIDAISQDSWWTGMGIPKAKVRQSNRIDNRTFGKYNGLDKIEARTLASAMTRLFGKDKVGEGFKALGLSTDLLTNKTMFNNVTERLAYERYTRNDKKNYPILSPNAPKFAMGGLVGYKDGGEVKPKPPKPRFGLDDIARGLSNPVIQGGAHGTDVLGGMDLAKSYGNIFSGKGDFFDFLSGILAPFALTGLGAVGSAGRSAGLLGKGKDLVKTKIATANAKKVLGIMGGKDAAKLSPQVSAKMTSKGLEQFISDGKYKTIFDNVRSTAGDSVDERSLIEAATGMSKALKLKPGQSPAYGFLGTKEAVPFYHGSVYGNNSGQGAQQLGIDTFNKMINPYGRPLQSYGSTVLNLKPSALRNATVSFGDSLSIYQQAVKAGIKTPQVMKLGSLLTTLRLSSMARKTKGILGKEFEMPYAEIHMRSGFGLDDVSGVGVSNEFKDRVPEAISAVEALLAKAGRSDIPVYDIIGRGKNALDKMGQNIAKPLSGMVQKPNSPFSPILGPMQGASLPFGFSKAPTKAEMDAVVAFIQNSPLAQIQRGDALASIVGKSQIAKGTAMFRVPTIRQNEELATKKVGDIIELGKRFTSIAGQSELQAIGMTAAGKLNTGNRERPVNTIMKFIAGEDIPGILNHKVYNQNYLKNAFGAKADEYPFQSEGILPPGLKGKIVGVSQSGDQRILEVLISKFAGGGMVRRYAGGGFVSGRMPMSEPIPKQFANGGLAMGTDTVPAMLTPGEFVIKKSAVDRIGPSALTKINGYAEGGLVGGMSAELGNSVYNNNTYEINVNVSSNSNPDQIANAVMTRIRQIDNKRVRGSAF